MNSEQWLTQNLTTNLGWVETGVTQGWIMGVPNCGYFAFAAWSKEDGTGYTERAIVTLTANSSTTDRYQIKRSGTTNVFTVKVGSLPAVTTSDVQFYSTQHAQVGGEIVSPWATASPFNMHVNAVSTSGTLIALPSPKYSYVDTASNLTGSSPSNSYWNWDIT